MPSLKAKAVKPSDNSSALDLLNVFLRTLTESISSCARKIVEDQNNSPDGVRIIPQLGPN